MCQWVQGERWKRSKNLVIKCKTRINRTPSFSYNPKYPLKRICPMPQGSPPPRFPSTVHLWFGFYLRLGVIPDADGRRSKPEPVGIVDLALWRNFHFRHLGHFIRNNRLRRLFVGRLRRFFEDRYRRLFKGRLRRLIKDRLWRLLEVRLRSLFGDRFRRLL